MPRLTGILETALYVEDLERSESFYRTLFDFPVMVSLDRMRALKVPNSQVLLLFKKKGSLVGTPGGAHDGEGQLHMAFAIPADDFDAWESRLKQLGIPITEIVKWDRGGRSLYFRDPDGHLIELATPGVWANY
jgi:catechol 2,3-dioxygenase-like lactoylglutathione lyase family enzyme